MAVAANTFECFREFIGHKVVGVLRDALPVGNQGIASGTKTLVFDDGRGLTIASNGSWWIDRADDVARAIRSRQQALEATADELKDVLELAGVWGG
jgi:hypothetical protein